MATKRWLLIGALMPWMVQADSVGELSKIQTSTLILKAKLQEETARAQLAEIKTGKSTGPNNSGSASTSPITGMGLGMNQNDTFGRDGDDDKKTEVPLLEMVLGRGKQLFAEFKYSSGASYRVKAGDTLPGGIRVTKVALDEVLLSMDGNVIRAGSGQ